MGPEREIFLCPAKPQTFTKRTTERPNKGLDYGMQGTCSLAIVQRSRSSYQEMLRTLNTADKKFDSTHPDWDHSNYVRANVHSSTSGVD